MKRLLLNMAAVGALLVAPALAQAAEGIATANVNMRAGPSTSYPAVVVIPAGASLEIRGCLSDVPWCDVEFYGGRGWVAGRYLQVLYQRQRVYVAPEYYRPLGIPTIEFSVGNYWDRYYRNRSFYRERDRWRRSPPRPEWDGPRPNRPPPEWDDGPDRRPNWDRRPDRRPDWDRRPDRGPDWDRDGDRQPGWDRDRRRDWDQGGDDRRPDWDGGRDRDQGRNRDWDRNRDRQPNGDRRFDAPDRQPDGDRRPDRRQPPPPPQVQPQPEAQPQPQPQVQPQAPAAERPREHRPRPPVPNYRGCDPSQPC